MSAEQWRSVVWAPGYEVSDQGRVRSWMKGGDAPRILKLQISKLGRPSVTVSARGIKRPVVVHRLVAEAFLGPRSEGMEVCHRDGDKANNAVTNLRYDTRAANNLDAVRHGMHPHASKTHCPSGHPYDETNTRRYRSRRYCRACHRDLSQRRRAALKEAS